MSAILGIFQRNKKPVSRTDLEKMSQVLAHRGKDGKGLWINGAVGFGHLMRWITPESLTEKLPYHNNNSRLAITADARIDNRNELFNKLAVPKEEQKTLSDSELILLAYEKWAEQCVDYLIGDFVFAIWDDRNQKIFCATDPMGMRPVYYYLDDKLFVFASEIKALLTLTQIPKKLNEEQFARDLVDVFSMQEGEQTCFSGISLLTSGTVLTVNNTNKKCIPYWKPDFSRRLRLKSEKEYLEAFREIFDESVHCRMRSAYPIASMLSGGLDSSSIASVAARKLQEKGAQLTGLSSVLPLGYQGSEKDERYYIDLVRDRWKMKICYVTPPGNGVYDRLEHTLYRAEYLHITSRHYLYTALQNAAAENGARVILDGFGGEFSATTHGFGYHAELAKRGKWVRLAKELWARKSIENQSLSSLISQLVLRPFAPNWLEKLHEVTKYGYGNYIHHSPIHPEFAKKMKVKEQLRAAGENIHCNIRPSVRQNEARALDSVRGSTIGLVDSGGPELVFPFLDQRLIEFCISIPDWLKTNNGWKRYLIRAGMDGMLPPEVQWRTTKQAFSPDHARRTKAAEVQARILIADIDENNSIRKYVDVSKMSHLLDLLKHQPEFSHDDVYTLQGRASIVQRGVYAIAFSSAFSQLF